MYLDYFIFPDADKEFDFLLSIKRTCYSSYYPFQILSARGFERIDFEPVTILYGGNGSGKTTALNVIAEKTGVKRDSIYNRSSFFPDYVDLSYMGLADRDIPANSRIISSDDVFDYMLNIRNLNEGIDLKRQELFDEYLDAKYSDFQLKSMADYDQLKKINKARRKTQSRFVKSELMDNVRGFSNGEVHTSILLKR